MLGGESGCVPNFAWRAGNSIQERAVVPKKHVPGLWREFSFWPCFPLAWPRKAIIITGRRGRGWSGGVALLSYSGVKTAVSGVTPRRPEAGWRPAPSARRLKCGWFLRVEFYFVTTAVQRRQPRTFVEFDWNDLPVPVQWESDWILFGTAAK